MPTLHKANPNLQRVGTNPRTGQPWRLTDAEVKAETNAELAKMKQDRKLAGQFLKDVGLLTATGKVSRRFGGGK